jgi:hypothetical protein
MVMKELIKLTSGFTPCDETSEQALKNFLDENPDVVFYEVDDSQEPEIRRHILSSAGPTVYPCYIAVVDGDVVSIKTGSLSKEDVATILN